MVLPIRSSARFELVICVVSEKIPKITSSTEALKNYRLFQTFLQAPDKKRQSHMTLLGFFRRYHVVLKEYFQIRSLLVRQISESHSAMSR